MFRRVALQQHAAGLAHSSCAGFFQILLVIGNKRWKARPSIRVVSVVLSLSEQYKICDLEDYVCVYLCDLFKRKLSCSLIKTLLLGQKVKEKIWAFVDRRLCQSSTIDFDEQWEIILFPFQEGDYCSFWHVFRPKYLHYRRGSFVTAAYDERKSRAGLCPTLRVRCISCSGAACNRQLCIHEKVCLQLRLRNSEVLWNVQEVEDKKDDEMPIQEEVS